MKRPVRPVAAFVAIYAMLSGCVSEAPDPVGPGTGDVVIVMTNDLTYAPATAHARVGQTVVWQNPSSMPHTVTADPSQATNEGSVSLPADAEPFASPLVSAGGAYSRVFTVAGTYRYFCQPHEGAGMIGVLIVAP